MNWKREKLIRVAQAYDKKARRARENGNAERYSRARRLAFTARDYARWQQDRQVATTNRGP